MRENFNASLKLVLKHEGGFVNHPQDPGGATNKGVTIATYRAYLNPNGSVADLKALTDEQAGVVYKRHYWDKVEGDALPAGVDYAAFDFAVNSGPDRAAKYLQMVVGSMPDGKVGPLTIKAAKSKDAALIINELCDRRLHFLMALKTWGTFGKGWSSRVKGVREAAIKMAKADNVVTLNIPKQDTAPVPVAPVAEPQSAPWLTALINSIINAFKGTKA